MRVAATSKWVRVTARKARVVAHTVEGLPVAEALAVLAFTPRAVATDIAKVIKSAAANAQHNFSLDEGGLRVERVEIEGAAIIKRFIPKPRGTAGSLFKRTCHIRAYVTDEPLAEGTRRPRSVKLAGAAVITAAPTAAPARKRATRASRKAAISEPTSVTPSEVETKPTRAPRARATKPSTVDTPSTKQTEPGNTGTAGDEEA